MSAWVTGCGITHSDIGGYTSLFDNCRTKELFLRWAEMNVFTPVMRTHESNRPDTNFQYYNDEDTLNRLAQLVKIHRNLMPYIKSTVKESFQKGMPVQRPLLFHYPDESLTYDLKYEYLFGRDILMAPIYEKGTSKRKLYLPKDEWVDLWTRKVYNGGWVQVDAPLGFPPVFFRGKSSWSSLFEQFRK